MSQLGSFPQPAGSVSSIFRRWKAAALVAVMIGVVGCGGARSKASSVAEPHSRSGTVWRCRPGLLPDPCASDLTRTVVERSGATRVEQARPAHQPGVDCF